MMGRVEVNNLSLRTEPLQIMGKDNCLDSPHDITRKLNSVISATRLFVCTPSKPSLSIRVGS